MQLHFEEFGAPSTEAVVLLHGAPTTPEYMDLLARPLAQSRYVLRVDLPGYGRSAAVSTREPFEAVAVAIEEAVERRGVLRVALVGFSGGGYRAVQIASAGRLNVTHVVSIAGHAALSDEERAGLRASATALRTGVDFTDIVPSLFLAPLHLRGHPEAGARVLGWMRALAPEALADELEAFAAGPDLRDSLRRLQAPLLAIVGELDAASPPHRSRALARAARNGRVEVLPGRGHALLYEALDETLARVEAFLSDTSEVA